MSESIAQLVAKLEPDPWRERVGFSPEITEVNARLFDQTAPQSQLVEVLSRWMQRHQPCLFGRIAARSGYLSYCILTEADLKESDESISAKIQTARLRWTRDGFEGRKNGFIIIAVSERLAHAVPDNTLRQLALRLCSLYLQTNVVADQVFLDELFLEKPGSQRTTWRWPAGVNYFSAQGDRRWWQDHRIPGGMAFSINSVGHMVKSGILAKAMLELEEVLRAPTDGWVSSKVDSLGKALELAMTTISLASDGVSGKATELLDLPQDIGDRPIVECPVALPPFLANKNYCQYIGHYHTDYTVPSEYFRRDIERPLAAPTHVLDFTYLFDQNVDNPDYTTMGEGRPVRAEQVSSAVQVPLRAPTRRWSKMAEQEIAISGNMRLLEALKFH